MANDVVLQTDKVGDYLDGPETSDRMKLKVLTKDLQIISQNANLHIANAECALATTRSIVESHKRLRSVINYPHTVQ
jgi:hypothetical protein